MASLENNLLTSRTVHLFLHLVLSEFIFSAVPKWLSLRAWGACIISWGMHLSWGVWWLPGSLVKGHIKLIIMHLLLTYVLIHDMIVVRLVSCVVIPLRILVVSPSWIQVLILLINIIVSSPITLNRRYLLFIILKYGLVLILTINWKLIHQMLPVVPLSLLDMVTIIH